MLKSTIFREYDIRGIADEELLSPDVADLGRGLGAYLQRQSGNSINVGRDCRLSSTRLRDALIEGLLDSGCEVTDIGVVPTPLLYYSAVHLQADGAVMITGSHNPSEFNGFKTVCGAGTLYGEAIQDVRRLIEERNFAHGRASRRDMDVSTAYVDQIVPQFDWERRIKVVMDAGNGTAGPVMRRLLSRLNVEATELFFEMDGHFPNHHPDPTVPENLNALRQAVKTQKADLGIAFDGDSDRIGAIDENGEVIYGDMLLLIFGREILTRKPGATFIGEVKCSQILYDELKRLGGNPIMYKTGHSLIKAKMKEEHAELAGEMSGHMFFADRYFGYDDALYAACRLMEIVAKSGQPLSAQLAGIPKTVATPEIRMDCPDDTKFDVVRRVAEAFRSTHKVI
ncbi:MAG: phosphomannomutase/phosphoglucomutase, partial [Bryobacterales bacterium]|nr:phosphomannomutase/phosphoglucomutase [Bryobacterales bacterium]